MTKKEFIEVLQQRTWIPDEAKVFFNDQRGNLIEVTAIMEEGIEKEGGPLYRATYDDEENYYKGRTIKALVLDNMRDFEEIREMLDKKE